jgi:hypothetical protein
VSQLDERLVEEVTGAVKPELVILAEETLLGLGWALPGADLAKLVGSLLDAGARAILAELNRRPDVVADPDAKIYIRLE